nr:response regulator [uncultured Sphingomonas sp.]
MLFGTRERHVKRILIVEDEPLVAFDNETMVASAGYTVVATVDSVREALAILDRELAPGDGSEDRGVDLVLTDIMLNGQRSGMDLAVEARARDIPVLFATANPPEEDAGTALGVLCKPYNERRLKAALKVVEQLLDGKTKVSAPDGVILYNRPLAA